MAQPPPYNPLTSFITYQAQQAWFPGQQLDVEFNALQTSVKAVEANLVILQNDDGTLGHGLVGWDQFSPALQVSLRSQNFSGAPTSGPNTWVGLQTFPDGASVTSLALGTATSPASHFDIEPNTPKAGSTFATPIWYFADLTTAGYSFSSALFHNVFTINGVRTATAGVPNPTGSYCAFTANLFAGGASASDFCVGGLLEVNAAYNPFGQNSGLLFGGNSQVVLGSVAALGGVVNPAGACAHEFDLYLSQPVAIKEGIRVADLSDSTGTHTDTNNSGYIRVIKASTSPGLPYGLTFSSDFIAGSYADAGFPIQTGGAGIFFAAPTRSLYAALDASALGGGFSIAGIILPAANPGLWWGGAGGGGKINSSASVGGPTMTFANGSLNVNKPLVLDAGAATQVDLSFQQNAVEQWQIGTLANGHFYAKDIVNSSAFVWQMTTGGTFAFTPPVSFAGAITATAAQTITVAAAVGLTVQSSAIGSDAWIALGTSTTRLNIAAVGTATDFFSGTAQGDAALQAVGSLHLGSSVAGKLVKIYTDAGTLATTIDATQNLAQVGNVIAAAYKVGSNQVVGARATGWTVATGTPQRSTFTTSGVTLAQLAGVVMALEQDLIAHGLIGT